MWGWSRPRLRRRNRGEEILEQTDGLVPRGTTFQRPVNSKNMTNETAMKILGLVNRKTKDGVMKKLKDYTEDEVLDAFQEQCSNLSKCTFS